jgi:saccharopine dehydrogenase (NAD+, L-lysine-forming)
MDRPVVVLGGYGETGRRMAQLLARRTRAPLVLAGRDAEKATSLAMGISAAVPDARVRGLALDVADPSALRGALEGSALVVNALSRRLPHRAIAEAAVRAGADVLDLQYPAWDARGLGAIAEGAGRCVTTQAGFHPGIPAVLARWAADRVDALDAVWTAGLLRQRGGIPFTPAVDDLVESFRGYRTHELRDGRWERIGSLSPRAMPAVWFDFGFGRRRTALMDLDEVLALPEIHPSLERAGFSIAGFDPVTDWVVMTIIWAALPLFRRRPVTPLSRLLCWSTRTFSSPPHGVVIQLEASGEVEGRPARLRLGMFHEDGYDLTAIPAVSMAEQLLDGSAGEPGVHLMGLLADPERTLTDMREMGARTRAWESRVRAGA